MLLSRKCLKSLRPKLLIEGQHVFSDPFRVPSNVPRPPTFQTQSSYAEVKSSHDIMKMREVCKIAANALNIAKQFAEEGVTTEKVDEEVSKYIVSCGAYPSGIGFMGFPKSICASVNEVVVHGIPDNRELETGDIVNFDITCWKDGFYGDCSAMVMIGQVDENASRLVKACKSALNSAIEACVEGERFSVIPESVTKIAHSYGFVVSGHFSGHFIGRQLHEPPNVTHDKATLEMSELIMKEGHIFTIEPILIEKESKLKRWSDGWTYLTDNGALAAQWEHTVLILKNGCEPLTVID